MNYWGSSVDICEGSHEISPIILHCIHRRGLQFECGNENLNNNTRKQIFEQNKNEKNQIFKDF